MKWIAVSDKLFTRIIFGDGATNQPFSYNRQSGEYSERHGHGIGTLLMHAAQTVSLQLQHPTVIFAPINVTKDTETVGGLFKEFSTVSWYRGHLFFAPLFEASLKEKRYAFLQEHTYGQDQELPTELQWHQSPNALLRDYLLANQVFTNGADVLDAARDVFIGKEQFDEFERQYDFETNKTVVQFFTTLCKKEEMFRSMERQPGNLLRLLHVSSFPRKQRDEQDLHYATPPAFQNSNQEPFSCETDK